ncbi:MAG: flagellar biosynthetic protein FliO [Methylophaga sp.]|nr:MAG: flagellar biosynthetic protein FliO [Methylophaga sp.]
MKLLSYLVLACFTSISFAAEIEKTADLKTLSGSPLNSTVLLETLGGLLLVLAIIAFLTWLLRRTGQFNSAANGKIKIIAGLSLGSREKAVLLQVGEQQILLGVTPQHIQTLHILENNIETQNKAKAVTSGFADKLQQMMKKNTGPQS